MAPHSSRAQQLELRCLGRPLISAVLQEGGIKTVLGLGVHSVGRLNLDESHKATQVSGRLSV